MNKEKILVTGASGFIGSFLIEGGLSRGYEVWAGVRRTSSRRYLGDSRLHFAVLDFSDRDRLAEQLAKHKEEHGGWDFIVHCAGVTKCRDEREFEAGNYTATRNLIEGLSALDMTPRKFIYLSSLSIFGPVRESDYSPILLTDTPQPNTAYGRSKLLAERFIKGLTGFPYIIYRPTGVYGPREKDYFLMMQSIKNHVDFAAGFKRQDITFVYVKDLVKAIFLGVEAGQTRSEYFVSDGKVYASRTFSDLVRAELGSPWMVRFVCPLFLLRLICGVGGFISRLTGKPGTLNPDKYKIMKQRNWQCDITPLVHDLGYEPEYDLERGVKEAVAWYKKEKWL